jgi:hypothetical protein
MPRCLRSRAGQTGSGGRRHRRRMSPQVSSAVRLRAHRRRSARISNRCRSGSARYPGGPPASGAVRLVYEKVVSDLCSAVPGFACYVITWRGYAP